MSVVKFLDLIRGKYVSSGTDIQPMDVVKKSQFFTLNTIMGIATGAPI
jgi:hypothetical protein